MASARRRSFVGRDDELSIFSAALAEAEAHPPDIVICDVGLPELNGYEVARALRANRRTAHAFLIALTGYGRETDRTRALLLDTLQGRGMDHNCTIENEINFFIVYHLL